jgi:hypothetical protein
MAQHGTMDGDSRARGLTTVALLKAQFDHRQDHISMFEPFLLDVIFSRTTETFSPDELRTEFHERHGLLLPPHAFKILLRRATRRGYVIQRDGNFVRQRDRIPNVNLVAAKKEVEADHAKLAAALRSFAESKGRQIDSDGEALALLLTFLEENQFALLLDQQGAFELTSPPSLGQKDATLIPAFLISQVVPSGELNAIVQRMLEGFVLQNVLLLKDIGSLSGHFADLTVFFDTRFLFAALGLHGADAHQAAREDLDLLKSTSAKLAVFDKTLAEMRRVLSVYENKLATSKGIQDLYPGPLTTYFLGNHYRPSDIRQVIALLDRNIRDLGMTIRTLPQHNPKYTLDEEDLAKRIAGAQGENEPRVIHDVDCIAAILTLRGGRRADSWERAHAVFSTTTGRLVGNAIQWYRDSGEKGVPPLIHQFSLSSIAWLKRPASAQNLKLHELVALCSAALRPSRTTWQAFLDHLRKLEKTGTITSDEAVSIVVNELTQTLLLDTELISDDNEPNPELISEVVERVRASYRAEAHGQVETIRASAVDEIAAVRAEVSATLVASEKQLGAERERIRQLHLRLEKLADRGANVFSLAFFVILGGVLLAGSFFSFSGITAAGTRWEIVVRVLVAVTAVAGAYTLVFGSSVRDLRGSARQWIRGRIQAWLLPETLRHDVPLHN